VGVGVGVGVGVAVAVGVPAAADSAPATWARETAASAGALGLLLDVTSCQSAAAGAALLGSANAVTAPAIRAPVHAAPTTSMWLLRIGESYR